MTRHSLAAALALVFVLSGFEMRAQESRQGGPGPRGPGAPEFSCTRSPGRHSGADVLGIYRQDAERRTEHRRQLSTSRPVAALRGREGPSPRNVQSARRFASDLSQHRQRRYVAADLRRQGPSGSAVVVRIAATFGEPSRRNRPGRRHGRCRTGQHDEVGAERLLQHRRWQELGVPQRHC